VTGGGPGDGGAAASARLETDQVRLRALDAGDLDWLRRAETDAQLAFRWRLHGAHPSPMEYADQVWAGTLALFVVEAQPSADRPDGGLLGLVSAYQPDHRNGHCRVAAARLDPAGSADALFLGGVALFLDYLFQGWSFRKVYLETPEFNVGQFRSAIDRGVMRVEARLEEFVYLDGSYWDVLFLAVGREAWGRFGQTALGCRLLAKPAPALDLVDCTPVGTALLDDLVLVPGLDR